MPFQISNVAHVSRLIEDSRAAVLKLHDFRQAVATLQREVSVNGIDAALGAGGAVFPAQFILTVAQISNALGSLAVASQALDTAINSGELGNLDTLRLSIGALTGTG